MNERQEYNQKILALLSDYIYEVSSFEELMMKFNITKEYDYSLKSVKDCFDQLATKIDEQKDIRFIQLLSNLHLIEKPSNEHYNQESKTTYINCCKMINKENFIKNLKN